MYATILVYTEVDLWILEVARFPMVVDPKCRGLGTQTPAADNVNVLAFKNMKF